MTTTQSATKPTVTQKQKFATLLGWEEKVIGARLNALNLMAVCTRCGGSGHYSFCQQWGTTCFKCAGSGKQLPNLTKKLAKQVVELVTAGGLTEYFARVERIKAAKRAIPALVAECIAVYKVIADAYSAESKAETNTAEFVAGRTFKFQGRNNRIRWGSTSHGSWDVQSPRFMSVSDVEYYSKKGELEAPEAVRILEQRKSELTALVAEFREEEGRQ